MTDDPHKAHAAWQDVEQVLQQEPNLHVLKILIADAKAADAQQIAALREELTARLNEATRLVDEERRRWYAAIGGDCAGLAPEIIGQQIAALRAEADRWKTSSDSWWKLLKIAEAERDTLQAELKIADDCYRVQGEELLRHIQIAERLQAEQAQWQPIETAPTDGTLVIVRTNAVQDLEAFVTVCRYHPDAGWCVDELREVTHWMLLPLAALTAQQEKPVE